MANVMADAHYAPPTPAGGSSLRRTVTVSPLEGRTLGAGFIPTPLYPDQIRAGAPLRLDTEGWTVRATAPLPGPYTVQTELVSVPHGQIVVAPVASDGFEVYLDLPNSISRRVRVLARDIAGREKSPYSRAVALMRYLNENYTYDFGFENAPTNREPTDWFLFEDHRGVCANFSNAFTIMAREVGIPTRPVAGRAVSPIAAAQTVTAAQAHQWIEVYFEEIGWVTFDPTPPGGAPSRADANAAAGPLSEDGPTGTDETNDPGP